MSDFARLEDKLAKLRQRERIAGEGRRLRGATPEALLAAVVTEIDETILPRRLTFDVENGPTVHIAVASRKLQALVSPAPDIRGADAGGLADAPLSDPEDAAVAALRAVFLAAFADAGTVAIRSARPAGAFASDVGIPANILGRAWGIESTGDELPSAGELLSRFLSEVTEDTLGWLRIEGEDVTDQGGDAAVVEALGEQAAIFLDSYFGKFEALYPEPSDACATFIGPVEQTGAAVLFVEIGEVSAFIAAKAQRGPEILAALQRLTGA